MMDTIQYVAQTGRLDLVSALLACVAIMMMFGGVFAFLNIRYTAKKISEKVAEKIAKVETEKHVNIYIQKHLPSIISAYQSFIEASIEGSVADHIAAIQEDENDCN